MTNEIKYERTSDTARLIWAASWAVEKIAREIGDISKSDLSAQDMDDIAYLTGLCLRRAQTLYELVPTKSL